MIRSLARMSTAALVGCALLASSASAKFQSSEEWPVSSEDAILNVMLEQLQQKTEHQSDDSFTDYAKAQQSNTADDFSAASQALDTSNDLLSEYAAQLFATATPPPTQPAMPLVSVSSEASFATVTTSASGNAEITLVNPPSATAPTPIPVYLPFASGAGVAAISSVTVFPGCGDPSCEVLSYNTDFVCVSVASCAYVSVQGYLTLVVPPNFNNMWPYRSTVVFTDVGAYSFAYYLDVYPPGNLVPYVNQFNTTATYYPTTTFTQAWNSTLDNVRQIVTTQVTVQFQGAIPALVPLYGPFSNLVNVVNATSLTNCATPLCLSGAATDYLCVDGASCGSISKYNYFTLPIGSTTAGSVVNSLTLGSSTGWTHVYIITVQGLAPPPQVNLASNCFVDNVPLGTRLLTTRLYPTVALGPTTLGSKTYCQSLALAGYYLYYGVEYGGECWAGNTFNLASTTSGATCNMPCNGNSAQTCGGFDSIQVYAFNQ